MTLRRQGLESTEDLRILESTRGHDPEGHGTSTDCHGRWGVSRRGWTGHLTSGPSLPHFLWCTRALWAAVAGVESALCGASPMPTVGSPATSQSRGQPAALSRLSCPGENIPRAEGCPEKAQQSPGLGPGSESTSKRTHNPPALADETAGCQETSGRPRGPRPFVGACQDMTAEVRAYIVLGGPQLCTLKVLTFF